MFIPRLLIMILLVWLEIMIKNNNINLLNYQKKNNSMNPRYDNIIEIILIHFINRTDKMINNRKKRK